MTSIVEHLLNVRGVLVYLLVGLLVLVEDALFVGFVIPGETAAVLGGVIASRGHLDYPLIAVIVVAAAIIGDTVGYEIGRHLGPRILHLPILDQRRGRLDDAAAARSSSAASSPSSAPSCPPSPAVGIAVCGRFVTAFGAHAVAARLGRDALAWHGSLWELGLLLGVTAAPRWS